MRIGNEFSLKRGLGHKLSSAVSFRQLSLSLFPFLSFFPSLSLQFLASLSFFRWLLPQVFPSSSSSSHPLFCYCISFPNCLEKRPMNASFSFSQAPERALYGRIFFLKGPTPWFSESMGFFPSPSSPFALCLLSSSVLSPPPCPHRVFGFSLDPLTIGGGKSATEILLRRNWVHLQQGFKIALELTNTDRLSEVS